MLSSQLALAVRLAHPAHRDDPGHGPGQRLALGTVLAHPVTPWAATLGTGQPPGRDAGAPGDAKEQPGARVLMGSLMVISSLRLL